MCGTAPNPVSHTGQGDTVSTSAPDTQTEVCAPLEPCGPVRTVTAGLVTAVSGEGESETGPCACAHACTCTRSCGECAPLRRGHGAVCGAGSRQARSLNTLHLAPCPCHFVRSVAGLLPFHVRWAPTLSARPRVLTRSSGRGRREACRRPQPGAVLNCQPWGGLCPCREVERKGAPRIAQTSIPGCAGRGRAPGAAWVVCPGPCRRDSLRPRCLGCCFQNAVPSLSRQGGERHSACAVGSESSCFGRPPAGVGGHAARRQSCGP